MTLIGILPRGDIGVEMHPDTDQFICVEEGQAETSTPQRRMEQKISIKRIDDWRKKYLCVLQPPSGIV